jgi:hypothetical protein
VEEGKLRSREVQWIPSELEAKRLPRPALELFYLPPICNAHWRPGHGRGMNGGLKAVCVYWRFTILIYHNLSLFICVLPWATKWFKILYQSLFLVSFVQ